MPSHSLVYVHCYLFSPHYICTKSDSVPPKSHVLPWISGCEHTGDWVTIAVITCIKMRSYWNSASPSSSMTSVFIRRGDTQSPHRAERHHVTTEAEIIVMGLWTEKHQGLLAALEVKRKTGNKTPCLESSKRECPCQHLDFRYTSSRTVREYTSAVLSHPLDLAVICYSSLRKLTWYFCCPYRYCLDNILGFFVCLFCLPFLFLLVIHQHWNEFSIWNLHGGHELSTPAQYHQFSFFWKQESTDYALVAPWTHYSVGGLPGKTPCSSSELTLSLSHQILNLGHSDTMTENS